jgi:hypothetical protein
MATKNETSIFSWLGAGLNVLVGYNEAKKVNQPFTFGHVLARGALGAIGGAVVAEIVGEPSDTVNYTHYHKGKVVYHGVTYEDRLDKRTDEHRKSGKKFDKVVFSEPKPRSEAFAHERKMINKHRPKNNIHHNLGD